MTGGDGDDLGATLDLWRPILDGERERGSEATLTLSYRPERESPLTLSLSGLPDARLDLSAADPEVTAALAPPPDAALDDRPRAAAGGEDLVVGETLGEGGMGLVLRANQRAIGREVALKIARKRDPPALALFLAEARVTARLEHANIVPVHTLGCTAAGTPCLVLKIIRGRSWRELLHAPAAESLTLKRHIEILKAVCNAVAFAHARGILHRDLKPDNVMVGEFGQVYVMDWGLAVRTGPGHGSDDADIPSVGDVSHPAGTPGYMAPELATGDGASQDRRTDVYLLGACLHEVLTGRPRHHGASVRAALAACLRSQPFRYDDSIPRELADLCNRATARDPSERFTSVGDFAAALERFLEHEQARVLTDEGTRLGDELAALLARAEQGDEERLAQQQRIYQLHGEARFAFQHALGIWPGATEARAGSHALAVDMIEHALAIEDVHLASRLLADVDDDDDALRARVDELAARVEARAAELAALRDEASRRDPGALDRPLGSLMLAVGGLGAAGVAGSSILRHFFPLHAGPLERFLLWLPIIAAIGAVALRQMRRIRVPASLVSTQTLGTWGAVILACVTVEVITGMLQLPGFRLLGATSLLFGVGVAALAMQTRRWLLAPAAAFYVASLLITRYPLAAREIFGLTILAGLGGLGLALHLGFSLAPRARD